MPYLAEFDSTKCSNCEICRRLVACAGRDTNCTGCGDCVFICPHSSARLVEVPRLGKVEIQFNGEKALVPERITVKEALTLLGYPSTGFPDEPRLFSPCETGGCWGCAVQVNGVVKRACLTPVKDGMTIEVDLPQGYLPRRIVRGFIGHKSGGVGTPWQLRGKDYLEAACFAAGCNFRCPQCQNWKVTYRSRGLPLTPRQAARKLTETRRKFNVHRLAISGGECTLNRAWLIAFLRELKDLNPEAKARFHVDTNGALLTHDYIDELVEAGMTDIGIDLKGLETFTFMKITGLKDWGLARKYKDTAWAACRYLYQRYRSRVFLGIGVPYNRDLISLDEIHRIGIKIRDEISNSIQVSVIDYRPEFRSRISRPTYEEMSAVLDLLKSVGLTTAIAHTESGQIGP